MFLKRCLTIIAFSALAPTVMAAPTVSVTSVAGSNIGFYSSDSDPDDNDTFTIVGGDSFGSPTVKMTFVDNDNGNLSTFECVFEASNPVFDRAENLASGNPFLWGEVQVADFGSDGVCDKLIVSRTID